MSPMTVAEKIADLEADIRAHQGESREPWSREMSLALTALEDCQMRFTRGLAKKLGKFNPADLERP